MARGAVRRRSQPQPEPPAQTRERTDSLPGLEETEQDDQRGGLAPTTRDSRARAGHLVLHPLFHAQRPARLLLLAGLSARGLSRPHSPLCWQRLGARGDRHRIPGSAAGGRGALSWLSRADRTTGGLHRRAANASAHGRAWCRTGDSDRWSSGSHPGLRLRRHSQGLAQLVSGRRLPAGAHCGTIWTGSR